MIRQADRASRGRTFRYSFVLEISTESHGFSRHFHEVFNRGPQPTRTMRMTPAGFDAFCREAEDNGFQVRQVRCQSSRAVSA